MSDRESFVTRWSRRKRDAAEEVRASGRYGPVRTVSTRRTARDRAFGDAEVSPTSPQGELLPRQRAIGSPQRLGEAAFDLAKLPPIESITAADRHPRLSRCRRSGGIDPCGASSRMGCRPDNPRLRRAVRECLGLQCAGRDPGLWAAGDDRGAAPADRASRRPQVLARRTRKPNAPAGAGRCAPQETATQNAADANNAKPAAPVARCRSARMQGWR